MNTLNAAHIDFLQRMRSLPRIEPDTLNVSDSKILGELITLDAVYKVRGSLGWGAWKISDWSWDAIEDIEEVPTDATLGDELYERAEIETNGVLVGEPAEEIPCETCGVLFWSLDSEHVECRACDEIAGQEREQFEQDTRLNMAILLMTPPAPKKAPFTPRGHGPIALDCVKVKLILDAMGDLLTRTQRTRILKATENGGFDAGLKSLARVSAQIVDERKALSNSHAALMDRVDSLEGAK